LGECQVSSLVVGREFSGAMQLDKCVLCLALINRNLT